MSTWEVKLNYDTGLRMDYQKGMKSRSLCSIVTVTAKYDSIPSYNKVWLFSSSYFNLM